MEISKLTLKTTPVNSQANETASVEALRTTLSRNVGFCSATPDCNRKDDRAVVNRTFERGHSGIVVTAGMKRSVAPVLRTTTRLGPLIETALRGVPNMGGIVREQIRSFIRSRAGASGFSPSCVLGSTRSDLHQVGASCVSLLLLRSPPLSMVRSKTTFSALRALIRRNGVQCCNVSAKTLRSAMCYLGGGSCGVDTIRIALGLCRRRTVRSLLPLTGRGKVTYVTQRPFTRNGLIPETSRGSNLDCLNPLRDSSCFRFLARGKAQDVARTTLRFVLRARNIAAMLTKVSRTGRVRRGSRIFSLPPLDSGLVRGTELSETVLA